MLFFLAKAVQHLQVFVVYICFNRITAVFIGHSSLTILEIITRLVLKVNQI